MERSLSADRDPAVESRPNRRRHGDAPLSPLRTTRRTIRQTKLRTRRSRLRSPARLPANRPSLSTSPKRASPVVGRDAQAHAHGRRDRQVARGPAHAAAVISEREPWRHCGKLGRSTEWPMSTPGHAAARASLFGALVLKACLERMKVSSPGRRRAVKAVAAKRGRGNAPAGLSPVWLPVGPRKVSFPEWNCELRRKCNFSRFSIMFVSCLKMLTIRPAAPCGFYLAVARCRSVSDIDTVR